MNDELICPKCNEITADNQNCIHCDICCRWFHLKCSGLTRKRFLELGHNSSSYWLCKSCLAEALPFQKLTNNQFSLINSTDRKLHDQPIDFDKTCAVCTRRVINIEKVVPCYSCQKFIHRKCSCLSEQQIIDFGAKIQQWLCANCRNDTFPFNCISTHEILSDNFNSNEYCICNDITDLTDFDCLDTITELKLNKLDLNNFHPNIDNDIDHNLNFNSNFKYYAIHEFHRLCNKLKLGKSPFFSLMHTNICSLNKNLENLELLTTSLGHKFDVIALSETWITEKNESIINNLSLPGYKMYHGTLGRSLKGGCGFFVLNDLCFTPRTDLDVSYSDNESEFEANWIEIKSKNNKSSLVAVIYRHPRKRNDNKFLEYLTNTISRKIRKEKKTVFITGDFNINLLNIDSDEYTESFLNLLLSNFFQPHILQPSKILNYSKPSLIDNIFLNSIDHVTYSGNLVSKISDHMPNFIFCKNMQLKTTKDNRGYFRDYKNFNPDLYVRDLRKRNLETSINSIRGANEQYTLFHDNLLNTINKHVPLKPVTKRIYRQRLKPWITKGILKSISIKNKYYRKFLKAKEPNLYKKYKYYRDLINHLIRKSKKSYYASYFEKFKKNSKKLWSGVKEIINTQNNNNNNQKHNLLINGKFTSDSKTVANSFNQYFTSVAQKLVEKMKPSTKDFNDYLTNSNLNSMFLDPVTPEEVNDIVANLDESKSNDSYNIPTRLIKIVRHSISEPFSVIANSSFLEGIFPDKLKFAKVTPIHKGKSKLQCNNYRPISILPIFSKILEKLMNSRLVRFLGINDIIYKHQYGFQENKSTSLAILELQSQLINNIEKGLFSCCIFLDFSKAFDTVNHNILLKKLEHYGIRGIALSWFKAYLDKRKQVVIANGETSSEQEVKCGVPQGSVLGPLLFLLYINDIYNSSKELDFRLFADDTSILFADRNLDFIEQIVNSQLAKVSEWLLANKLSLNVSKSNFLLVSPRKVTKYINLSINNEKLKQENYTKYLGIIIDEKLNWKQHVKQVNLKISKGIGVLYKLREFVPKSTLRTLYNSFIQSHALYGILNWGCAKKSTLEPLKRNLRKAIRVADFAPYTAHSDPIFQRLKLLNFDNLYKLETAKFMFQISKEASSNTLRTEFLKTKHLHHYNTRQSSSLGFSLQTISTNFKRNFLTFDGVKLWNSLPLDLKKTITKVSFKSKIKHYLLEKL